MGRVEEEVRKPENTHQPRQSQYKDREFEAYVQQLQLGEAMAKTPEARIATGRNTNPSIHVRLLL